MYHDRRYIAAQGPIDESIIDFLRMIWEFQITSVICTANEIEAGRVRNFFRRFFSSLINFFFSLNFVVIGRKMKNQFNSVPIVLAKYI